MQSRHRCAGAAPGSVPAGSDRVAPLLLSLPGAGKGGGGGGGCLPAGPSGAPQPQRRARRERGLRALTCIPAAAGSPLPAAVLGAAPVPPRLGAAPAPTPPGARRRPGARRARVALLRPLRLRRDLSGKRNRNEPGRREAGERRGQRPGPCSPPAPPDHVPATPGGSRSAPGESSAPAAAPWPGRAGPLPAPNSAVGSNRVPRPPASLWAPPCPRSRPAARFRGGRPGGGRRRLPCPRAGDSSRARFPPPPLGDRLRPRPGPAPPRVHRRRAPAGGRAPPCRRRRGGSGLGGDAVSGARGRQPPPCVGGAAEGSARRPAASQAPLTRLSGLSGPARGPGGARRMVAACASPAGRRSLGARLGPAAGAAAGGLRVPAGPC